MKIEIDIDKLKSAEGYFNENDVKAIERLTGKPFAEVYTPTEPEDKYSDSNVAKMTQAEYDANREEILKSLSRK